MKSENFDYTDLELDELIPIKEEADLAYHNGDTTTMADPEYDYLIEVMETKGYKNVTVGARVPDNKEKVAHRYPMLSLARRKTYDNEMTDEDVEKILTFFRRHDENITIDTELEANFKYDGMAFAVSYDKGECSNIVSRGKDNIGRVLYDKFISCVPQTIKTDRSIELRFEAVIKSETYESKYRGVGGKSGHERNFVSGCANDDRVEDTRLEDIDFILVDAVYFDTGIPLSLTDALALFDEPNNYRAWSKITTIRNLQNDFESLMSIRADSSVMPYPTDGIVLRLADGEKRNFNTHDPYDMVAIKFPPKTALTKVSDIVYNLGRSGEYTPVLLLEPVELLGTMVRRASAYNYGYLIEHNIKVGDTVEIIKSGDIIPRCVRVVESVYNEDVQYDTPEHSYVDGVHLLAEADSVDIKVKKFVHACSIIGFFGYGESMFSKLSALCDYDFINIFDANIVNFNTLGSFQNGNTERNKFLVLLKAKKSFDINKVIMMLSIPKCGNTISRELGRKLSGLSYDFTSMDSSVIEYMTNGEGKEMLKNTIKRLYANGIKVNHLTEEKKDVMYKSFEMTIDKNYDVNMAGCSTKGDFENMLPKWEHTSLKKTTDYLITNSLESTTGKMKKAEKMGVKILTFNEAVELYNK